MNCFLLIEYSPLGVTNLFVSFIADALVRPHHVLAYAVGAYAAGVNFINILRAALTNTDPKSVKKTDRLTVFFSTYGIFERKSCS